MIQMAKLQIQKKDGTIDTITVKQNVTTNLPPNVERVRLIDVWYAENTAVWEHGR